MERRDNKFEPAQGLHYHWTEEAACFDCPCGAKELLLAEGGDMKHCRCGRVYRLVWRVEVSEHILTVDEELASELLDMCNICYLAFLREYFPGVTRDYSYLPSKEK